MPTHHFSLALNTEAIYSIYEGRTRFVLVRSDQGLRLQLPATNFRRFVTSDGIRGRFRVVLDDNNKLIELTKL